MEHQPFPSERCAEPVPRIDVRNLLSALVSAHTDVSGSAHRAPAVHDHGAVGYGPPHAVAHSKGNAVAEEKAEKSVEEEAREVVEEVAHLQLCTSVPPPVEGCRLVYTALCPEGWVAVYYCSPNTVPRTGCTELLSYCVVPAALCLVDAVLQHQELASLGFLLEALCSAVEQNVVTLELCNIRATARLVEDGLLLDINGRPLLVALLVRGRERSAQPRALPQGFRTSPSSEP